MSDLRERLQTALGAGYRVERELGAGGMSVVFLAEELALGRKVVVKVLRPELAAGLSAERFRREIHLAAGLQHPHIVPLFAAGEAAGLLYYTMPFVGGESLRARLRREGELPVPEALRVLGEVLDALEYAHAQGIVHRDIKPENVLFSGVHAVVADFGVAKALSVAVADTTLTGAGLALGTPAYMAPEQAAGDEHTDHRADLYAAGVMAYEMLAGRPPFFAPTPQALIAAHLTRAPEPLSHQRPGLAPGLDAAVMRCLAKRPADRWQSAHDLRRALGAMLTPTGGTTAVEAVAAAGAKRRGVPRVRRWMVAAGLVVAAAIAGSVAWSRGWLGGRSLVAQGVLATREPILVADFANRTADSALGGTIAGALRVDLSQSRVVGLVPPERVREGLARMSRPSDAPLTDQLAGELATREGIKAVLAGDVARLGNGYTLSARLIAPATSQELASFRETADDSTELIAALGRLSRQVRGRIGESLRAIEATPPLERVTTASLPALRKYTRAFDLIDYGGESDRKRGLALLEESVALDTAFAMAYRKLAVTLSNRGEQQGRVVDAMQRAMQHRDRLTELERYVTTATYYSTVDDDPAQAAAALRAAVEADPGNWLAWNNLSVVYLDQRKYPEAVEAARRATLAAPDRPATYATLVETLVEAGRLGEAARFVDTLRTRFNAHPARYDREVSLLAVTGRFEAADSIARQVLAAFAGSEDRELRMKGWLVGLAAVRGQMAEAERLAEEIAERSARSGDSALALFYTGYLAQMDVRLRSDPQRAIRRLDAGARRYQLERRPPSDFAYRWLAWAYSVAGGTRKAADMLAAMEAARDPRLRYNRFWDRIIAAYLAQRERRYDSALAALRVAHSRGCTPCGKPHLARVFDLAGMSDSAIAYYRRYVDDPSRPVFWDFLEPAHRAEAYEALGRLYEAKNDRQQALDFYGRFVDLWKDADPDLQPRVRAARERIAALTAEPRIN
ncbi:MAG: protein kinase domain-containing protein [Gemmatimonadales bacterium]